MNRDQCRKCGRSRKLTLTRAGPMCKRCTDWPPSLAWIAPVLVDVVTLTAVLVIYNRSEDGVRAVYAWCLVVAASAVSVSLNVAHAPPTTPARLVATLAPAALLAALELVMSEARRTRTAQVRTPHPAQDAHSAHLAQDQVRTRPDSAQDHTPHPAQVRNGAHQDRNGTRALVRTLLAEDMNVSAQRVMETTGVQRGRAYELLRQERAALNGNRA
jgi:hypothetical protein